jgi:predicted Zn finger-like uncharacterized protein
MRLTCPNCGAEYDVEDAMVPAAGRHVQCTACHTRWFVRGKPRPALSEDQILQRLETGRPRPRPVVVPDPVLPAVETSGPAAAAVQTGAAEVRVVEPPRREMPTKPAERPTVARPAPVTDPGPLRPAPRLDLGDAARQTPEPAPAPRSRFARGLLIALVPFVIDFGAYRFGGEIATRVPAAAPALDAYGDFVDDLRDDIQREIDALRARYGNAAPSGPAQ